MCDPTRSEALFSCAQALSEASSIFTPRVSSSPVTRPPSPRADVPQFRLDFAGSLAPGPRQRHGMLDKLPVGNIAIPRPYFDFVSVQKNIPTVSKPRVGSAVSLSLFFADSTHYIQGLSGGTSLCHHQGWLHLTDAQDPLQPKTRKYVSPYSAFF